MSIFSKINFLSIIRKINIQYLINNPMVAVIFIAGLFSTIILINEIHVPTGHVLLYFQISFWIWMTVFFAAYAEFYAKQTVIKNTTAIQENSSELYKKIIDINNISQLVHVQKNDIKQGDLLLLEPGMIIPVDGIVYKGKGYINETDITGVFGRIKKDSLKDNILTTGGIVESSQVMVMQVKRAGKGSLAYKVKRMLKVIKRHSLPSEVALQRILFGISVLFTSVTLSIWVIADYFGFKIPVIYLIDLIVVLLPTTISGLQHAIVTFSRGLLEKFGIKVRDYSALDSIVDVNVVLIDKTGTITIGKREMIDFYNLSDQNDEQLLENIFLSSLLDNTYEGKSIKEFSKKRIKLEHEQITDTEYKYFPFSFANHISGCNYDDLEIRKGSLKEIVKYIGCTVSELPEEVLEITKTIAQAHGTALLVTMNKEIIGIIHLRDLPRKGVQRKIEKLYQHGIEPILVTGDNDYSSSYVAEKVGIKKYFADCTPEKKLKIVQELQRQGYVVAMCGDGLNDSLALAQADLGMAFMEEGEDNQLLSGNIISHKFDISSILEMRNICKRMTVKRGALTVFSLSSDIAKYFVIVPALFTTAFPTLSVLNFMHFKSLESVILSSVMFNALVILALMPFLFRGISKRKIKYSSWRGVSVYCSIGIISPFLFIKLIEVMIIAGGLV